MNPMENSQIEMKDQLVKKWLPQIASMARQRTIAGRLDAEEIESIGLEVLAKWMRDQDAGQIEAAGRSLYDGSCDVEIRGSIRNAILDQMRAQVCESRDWRKEVYDGDELELFQTGVGADPEHLAMVHEMTERVPMIMGMTADEAVLYGVLLSPADVYDRMDYRHAVDAVVRAHSPQPPTRILETPSARDFASHLGWTASRFSNALKGLREKAAKLKHAA